MSGSPKEKEVRRLLSRAWSRSRRQANSSSIRNALLLGLNRELEEKGGHDSIKCFIAVLILEGSLYFVCTRIGLS